MLLVCACSQPKPVPGSWDICPEPRMIELLGDTVVYKPSKVVETIDSTLGNDLKPFQKEECYRIEVADGKIRLSAATETGLLRARTTLEKALPPMVDKGEVPALPSARVFDYPEFPYRAFMLDCGRHYFPTETVKQVLDILALHQINTFHWHLSEDQGWRIEIKKYPRLVEVGSVRAGDPLLEGGHNGIPHGGYYTQEEIKDIVAYASALGIEVVPEIDLPGHMQAALASYPELGCTGGPYEVACQWGVLTDVLCAGKPGTLQFVKDVLEEVMELFPSKYIHIGGDECPKERWEKCAECQAKIKELGLKADGHKTREELLQSWFMDEVSAFVEAHGRRCIAWNDPLVNWDNDVIGAPSKNTVIAGWMRPVSSEIAVKEGYDAILCPVGHLYLSAWDGRILKDDAYFQRIFDLNVKPEGLSADEKEHIIGVESCLWTESVSHPDSLMTIILPRISAVSELQWAEPSDRDLESFKHRVGNMKGHYSARGWTWNTAAGI